MTDHTPYPVISETSLESFRWRPFRDPRRAALHDLARRHPGSILVLRIDDQFVAMKPDGPVPGRIAAATMVAVVALHRRTVATTVLLPSGWRYTCVGVSVEFDCQVADAGLALQFGCSDVRPYLRRYLAEDAKARVLAAGADPLDFAAVQLRLSAHVVSRGRVIPPYIPGLVCSLAQVMVDLRRWPPDAPPVIDDTHGNGGSPNGHSGPAPQDYTWDG
jgi:hypothetical protein